VKGRRGPDRCGNTRDRRRDWNRFTQVRGCPSATEGTSGRRERLIFTEGRRKRPWQTGMKAPRESAEREARKRRRCQRYGSVGSAGGTCRAPTSTVPAEADSAS